MDDIYIPKMFGALSLSKHKEIQPTTKDECKEVLNANLNGSKVYLIGETRTIIVFVSDSFNNMFSHILIVDNKTLMEVLLDISFQLADSEKVTTNIIDKLICSDIENTTLMDFLKEFKSISKSEYMAVKTDLNNEDMSFLFDYSIIVNDFKAALKSDWYISNRYEKIAFSGLTLINILYKSKLYSCVEFGMEDGIPVLNITYYNKADNDLNVEKSVNFLIDVDTFKELIESVPNPKVVSVQEEDLDVSTQYRCCLTGLKRGSKAQEDVADILNIDRRLLI